MMMESRHTRAMTRVKNYVTYRIANLNGLLPLPLGRLGDLLAVFVRPRHKVRSAITVAADHAGVPCNGVGGDAFVGVAHVSRAVGVVDGRGDVVSFLADGVMLCFGRMGRGGVVAVVDRGRVEEGPAIVRRWFGRHVVDLC